MLIEQIATSIKEKLAQGKNYSDKVKFHLIGGGSINNTYRIDLQNDSYFCKINSATKFPQLFEKECHGLQLINQKGVIKVPETLHCFQSFDHQVLILEWIPQGNRDGKFWERFGQQLAALHQIKNEYFGLSESNYMGSVVQLNEPSLKWELFFYGKRIQPLISRCFDNGALTTKHLAKFDRLFLKLPEIFNDNQIPVLVHGDLWSGNFMCNNASDPVLIDPAVSYSHPSVDLGMSTLFGGFDQRFYKAYQYYNPFPSNYKEQWEVCNLYPLLIHLFLFGSSYLGQIEQTLHKF
jgi:protein-ribulosamine 3-kinase